LMSAWDRPVETFPSVLGDVDDFLQYPFQEAELLFRIEHVLQSKRSAVISIAARAAGKGRWTFQRLSNPSMDHAPAPAMSSAIDIKKSARQNSMPAPLPGPWFMKKPFLM